MNVALADLLLLSKDKSGRANLTAILTAVLRRG